MDDYFKKQARLAQLPITELFAASGVGRHPMDPMTVFGGVNRKIADRNAATTLTRLPRKRGK